MSGASAAVGPVSRTSPPTAWPETRTVDRRAEEVAVALDTGAVVQPDADRRRSVAKHEVMDNVQAQPNSVLGLGHAQHQRVSDGLRVRAAEGLQVRVDGRAEVGDERGGLLVAMRLR